MIKDVLHKIHIYHPKQTFSVFFTFFYRKALFNFHPKMRHSLFVDIQHLNKHKFIKNDPCEECRYLTCKMWSLRYQLDLLEPDVILVTFGLLELRAFPLSAAVKPVARKNPPYPPIWPAHKTRTFAFGHSNIQNCPERSNSPRNMQNMNVLKIEDILLWCCWESFFCWEKSVSCMGEVIY